MDLTANIVAPLAAFAVTLALLPVTIRICHVRGWLANPKQDRWHDTPTALFGGIALFAGVIVAMAISAQSLPAVWPLAAGAALMAMTGMADDVWRLPPWLRITIELAAAVLVVRAGLGFENAGLLGHAISVIWIVLAVNAVNLIDGADGVAASVVGVAALVAGLSLTGPLASVAFALAAACGAFLLFNRPPASIFMGDAGSLTIGYVLAVLAMQVGTGISETNTLLQMAVAFIFVSVPFMDAVFVALVRILVGVNPAKGGTHHIHHRLRMAGLSANHTVGLLAFIALTFTCTAALAERQPTLFGMLILFGIVTMLLLEVLLVHETGYLPGRDGEGADRRYLKRAAELVRRISPWPKVAADAVVVGTTFLVAGILVSQVESLAATTLVTGFALAVIIKLGVMAAFRLYAYRWLASTGTPDLIRLLAAIVASSAVLALGVALTGYDGVGARWIIVDFMASAIALVGMRLGYRAFRSIVALQRRAGQKVLLYGAGQSGTFAIREMRLNPKRAMNPVGFIDDDAAKHGAKVYGITVLGGFSAIAHAIKSTGATQLVLCSSKIPESQWRRAQAVCKQEGITCARMTFDFLEDARAPVFQESGDGSGVRAIGPPRLSNA